ncbi:TPA: hypothetical protein ACISZ4_004200, partial [Salmonella enterica subsp. enterica serovar Chester]
LWHHHCHKILIKTFVNVLHHMNTSPAGLEMPNCCSVLSAALGISLISNISVRAIPKKLVFH